MCVTRTVNFGPEGRKFAKPLVLEFAAGEHDVVRKAKEVLFYSAWTNDGFVLCQHGQKRRMHVLVYNELCELLIYTTA